MSVYAATTSSFPREVQHYHHHFHISTLAFGNIAEEEHRRKLFLVGGYKLLDSLLIGSDSLLEMGNYYWFLWVNRSFVPRVF